MTAELMIFRGVPASGKTTAALLLVDQGYVRVNRDDIRMMLFGKYQGVDEKAVTRVEHALVRQALLDGKKVVSDNTNLNNRFLSKLLEIARDFGAEVKWQDFVVTRDEAISRDYWRGMEGKRYVGGEVIDGFFNRYHIPRDTGILPPLPPGPRKWVPYVAPENKPLAYIVDTDGTVARTTNRSPYDTSRYADDAENLYVGHIVRALAGEYFYILGVSGRSEEFRGVTEEWWVANGLPFDEFFMRPAGDTRNDSEVKYDLFDQYIRNNYHVLAALDDRPRVLRMWRALGIPTLQVGDGREF